MAKRAKIKAGCGLVSVFLVGAFCGALVLFFVLIKVVPLSEGWRDEESKQFVLEHLTNRLNLSEEQVEQMRPMVYGALEERYEHRKIYVNADIEITGRALEEMRPLLDEEQVKRAEKMFENWKSGKERFLLGKDGKVKKPGESKPEG